MSGQLKKFCIGLRLTDGRSIVDRVLGYTQDDVRARVNTALAAQGLSSTTLLISTPGERV